MGIVLPALLIAVPFILLLAGGNALLGDQLHGAFATVAHWLGGIHFPELGRVCFWVFCSVALVSYLFPAPAAYIGQLCTTKWFGFGAPPDAKLSRWRSWIVLAVLNALFLWANLLDAAFLWGGGRLPVGTSYSTFVHEGVAALITTTLLLAAVIATLYQQDPAVTGNRPMRILTYLSIGQNVAMLASVFLRLKLYVDAFDLTCTRIHGTRFRFANPWPMGLVFFIGEWFGGLILHFDGPERPSWLNFLGFSAAPDSPDDSTAD